MSVLERVPASLRRAVRRVVPARVVDSVRDSLIRRWYLRSMVTRDSAFVIWARRHLMHRKPVLFHFEVHITDHCNLNCKGCAHFSNLCEPTFADLGEFEIDMNRMANLFSKVEEIYLLGGEPLLHPDVASFCRVARKAFPTSRICLMTNGILVTRMSEEFWMTLADTGVILLCDSYPINLPVDEIDRLGREHGVTVEWTIPREEFFKIPIDLAAKHDPDVSFKRCQGFNNCPIVRDGHLYPCAYIAYADVFRDYFDLGDLEVSEADSLPIREDLDPERVMEFLTHSVPWCAHCDMSTREFYAWGHSKCELSEWTKSAEC